MKKHERKFTAVLGVFGFILIGTILLFLLQVIRHQNYSVQKNILHEERKTKIYTSKNLNFQIEIPEGLEASDTGITVILSNMNQKITIIRNGTNFDNIDDYIADFDSKRNVSVSNIEKLIIDGNDAISRITSFSEQNVREKSFSIYKNNAVYVISTSAESLYGDLDKIALSFRYVE